MDEQQNLASESKNYIKLKSGYGHKLELRDTEDNKFLKASAEWSKMTAQMVFARNFRWTLEAEKLPPHFMKACQFDYKNKTVTMTAYEVAAPDSLLEWVSSVQEPLVFTQFDGCGEPICEKKMYGLEVVAVSSGPLDYSNSDISTITATLKFEEIVTNRWNSSGVIQAAPEWKLQVDDQEFNILLTKRPQIVIQETEISDQSKNNAWAIGKSSWVPVQVYMADAEGFDLVMRGATSGRLTEMTLHLVQNNSKLESWKLKNPVVTGHTPHNNMSRVTISYESVGFDVRIKDSDLGTVV